MKAVSSQAVTLNVPGMSRDLNLTQLQAQWVVSAYSLAYACGLLFSGRIADVYGRKLCFLIGMGVFVVFSIISGVMRVSPSKWKRLTDRRTSRFVSFVPSPGWVWLLLDLLDSELLEHMSFMNQYERSFSPLLVWVGP
jgi:MFS family permease